MHRPGPFSWIPALALAASCAVQTEGPRQGEAGPIAYRCEDEQTMRITRHADRVVVESPRGLDLELPASPPDQSVRYGESLYAVVVENGEALWMVSGKPPIACVKAAGAEKRASIG